MCTHRFARVLHVEVRPLYDYHAQCVSITHVNYYNSLSNAFFNICHPPEVRASPASLPVSLLQTIVPMVTPLSIKYTLGRGKRTAYRNTVL